MDLLQVIAEPTRRNIIELLWTEELSAGVIADHFDVTFGAVSQHLRKLREAQLVVVRQDGTKRLYRLDHARLAPFRGMLEAMWTSKLDQLAALVEDSK